MKSKSRGARAAKGPRAADVEAAMRESLHSAWGEYVAWRKAFLKKHSRKSVHQLRTSIRKLSSRLDLAGPTLAPKQAARLRDLLNRELKLLSEVRDAQVQSRNLREHRPEFLRWGRYRRFLERSEKKGIVRAIRKLSEWGGRRKRECLETLDRRLTDRLGGTSPAEKERVLRELKRGLGSAVLAFERLELELRPGKHKTFHRLRIQVKDLVYKMEMAQGLLELPAPFAKRLERLRQRLGKLQDRVAFLESSRGFLRKGAAHPHPRRELERSIVRTERKLAGFG